MKIYLVRHGQSRWQVERDDKDWNSPLTELGKKQASHLGQWLVNGPVLDNGFHVEIAALHASPYIRAQQTAEPLAQALDMPVNTNDDLREASFLVSDHLPQVDSPGNPIPENIPSPVYTTFKSQAERALQALVSSVDDNNGPVMAISHGGLISTLLRLVTGSDTISFWIYNASLHLIEWKRGRWHLVYLNLWDHLPPDFRTF